MNTRHIQDHSPVKPGETAVVVGAGASGAAAARLLLLAGAKVRLVEKNEANISDDIRALVELGDLSFATGEHTPEQFAGAALVVTSPGVPLHIFAPLLAEAGQPPLIGEMDLALRFVTEPIIAITGTSGKTTTTSLIAAMLETAGKKVFLGGNIGTPLSAYVAQDDKADVLVLEMSSFQLQSCSHLHPRVAVFLNFSENHLDQHTSMQEYEDAKFSLFAQQTRDDLAVISEPLLAKYINRDCRAEVVVIGDGAAFSDISLAGAHNRQNAEAAFLACQPFGVTLDEAQKAAAGFSPLAHRLELICERNGAVYINDSKCTTVDALRVALQSFTQPVILLAGGKFKGGDLHSLRPLLTERVKAVMLYGGSRDKFEPAWAGATEVFWHEDLVQAMAHVREIVAPGDVVLLSPVTASYDQYKNYMERGKHFAALAREM